MEEIEVSPICEAVGKKIAEVGGPALIVAVRHPNGELETSPPPQTVFEAGDLIIAMGTPSAVERLERMFQPPRVQSGVRPTIQGI
jgi:voltage-gated potassium channel